MDLLERYLKEVGRYLAPSDRDDILVELRSLLIDSLESRRVEGQSEEDALVALLKEHGSPRDVAAAYGREQYLIGPKLYPTFMMVMRIGLIVMGSLSLLGLLIAMSSGNLPADPVAYIADGLAELVGTLLAFVGGTVLGFALLQYFDVDARLESEDWDPRSLPAINESGKVNRVETMVGIAFSILFLFLLNFFRMQGGFGFYISPDFDNPMILLPVAPGLISAMMVVVVAQIAAELNALRVGRWQIGTRLIRLGLDLLGAFLFYLALVQIMPEVGRLLAGTDVALPGSLDRIPGLWLALLWVSILIDGAVKLYRMGTFRPSEVWTLSRQDKTPA